MSTLQVTLYGKPGCHLCEDALAELMRLRGRYPHAVEQVDITSDPELMRLYGERIPVLRVGDCEYEAPLERAVLERALVDGATAHQRSELGRA